MAFVDRYEQLPVKLQNLLKNQGHSNDSFVCGLKTVYTPKYGLPFFWIILSNRVLLICTTLKREGIVSIYTKDNLNSIRTAKDSLGNSIIELIHNHLDTPTLALPLPASVATEVVCKFLQLCCSCGLPALMPACAGQNHTDA